MVDALSFLGSAFQLGSIRPVEPPAADGEDGLTAGLRFIAASPIVRASLTGVAVVNFFNLMFEALFMLYAVRTLHVTPGLLGVVIGAGAVGGILGSVLCKRLTVAARRRAGLRGGVLRVHACRSRSCRSPRPGTGALILLMLFAAVLRAAGSASWCSTSASRRSSAW